MLEFTQFDIKTGKTLTAYDPETSRQVPRRKQVEHSYLEHWLDTHGLKATAQLAVANFYEGITDRDRQRLEAQADRYLVFTNGKKGYFADATTANLIVNGDPEQGITPIYAANQATAHHLVAYGSLVSSDGIASAAQSNVRILVIDDAARDAGETVRNWQGEPLEPDDLRRILDKMGDGTMLVSKALMADLRTAAEVTSNADLAQVVTQFRAASPDFPGIAKGTAGTSDWCEYLGVVAIVASNDIKGDDGRFSTPGIKQVSAFWVNRKADGEYGRQSVGPQVKGCLPAATIGEFNPEMLRKGQELAAIAQDPLALAARYVATNAAKRQHARSVEANPLVANDALVDGPVDAIAELLKADPHGVLVGFERVNRAMEMMLRNQRVDLATNGIEIPSAMAQHHSALKPWEVSNRDLPQGAIVVYYRSPFANIGSAAIGINNPRELHWSDPEADAKQGVAYLNPWTAKHVAVTDFDRDANGYFVGYVPIDRADGRQLAATLRAELAGTADLSPAQQYEAGRQAIAGLIADYQANPTTAVIQPGSYPLVVEEVIQRNAPENKPPDIIKADKVKHDWAIDQEPVNQAIWRAWERTANNPTGRVANAGMNLRSFALETQYIPDDQAVGLCQQIAQHYQQITQDHQTGKLVIPTDAAFVARGYPAYQFADRIKQIAEAGTALTTILDPAQRLAFSRSQLDAVHHLLNDFVDGPQAENLQTAVDVAKSQRGIDEDVQNLARALAYKDHALREHKQDPTIYKDGNLMPTNTQEPIGWGVEQANHLYDAHRLMENPHAVYYPLLPNIATHEQQQRAKAIADGFNALQQQGVAEKQIDKSRVNQQPTVVVKTPQGQELTIQRTCDPPDQDRSPLWDAQDGCQPDWTLTIVPHQPDPWNPEPWAVWLQVGATQVGETPRRWPIGYVAAAGLPDGLQAELQNTPVENLKQSKIFAVIHQPEIQIQPPLVEQPPSGESFAQARSFLAAKVAALAPAERPVMAGYLWHHAEYISAAIAGFQPEIITALESAQQPHLKLTGLQHNIDLATFDCSQSYQIKLVGEMGTITSNQADRPVKQRQPERSPTVPIEKITAYILQPDGQPQKIGVIPNDGLRLPSGTIVKARLALRDDTKRAFELNGQRLLIENVDRYDAKGCSFDDTPVKLTFTPHPDNHSPQMPKHWTPQLLVQFATDGETKILGTMKLATAQAAGLSPPMALTVPIDNQVQNAQTSKVGTLIVESVVGREPTIIPTAPLVSLPSITTPAITGPAPSPIAHPAFNPSRSDLRQWFEAIAQTADDPHDPRLAMVQSVGKALNAVYCAEHHLPLPTTVAQVATPLDYWHPNVTLTATQNHDRLMTIAQAQRGHPAKTTIAVER
jgi:hypothetical protein